MDKYYKDLLIQKSAYYDEIVESLKIIEKFIKRDEKIIVGGQAIDFALKAKNLKGIYDENAMPDYDIFSDKHFDDAYQLAEWLVRRDYKEISVINALHPSTMRIRQYDIPLIDITYVPTEILGKMPFIFHKGFRVVHPHVQIINQHRAMSHIYENPPQEVINQRIEKDLQRYELLYNNYPLRELNIANRNLTLHKISLDGIKKFKEICFTNFTALSYWLDQAQELGFSTQYNLGSFKQLTSPIEIVHAYVNSSIYDKISSKDIQAPFLEYLPEMKQLDHINIYKNTHYLAAHYDKQLGYHFANLQVVMMHILTRYILQNRIANKQRNYFDFIGYQVCQELVKWAAKQYYASAGQTREAYAKFLPTAEFFGDKEENLASIVMQYKLDYKNRKNNQIALYSQPKNVYPRDLIRKSVPKKYFEFDYQQSKIFQS